MIQITMNFHGTGTEINFMVPVAVRPDSLVGFVLILLSIDERKSQAKALLIVVLVTI